MTSRLARSVPVTLLAGAEPVPDPEVAAAVVGSAVQAMGRQPSEVAVAAPWGWAEAAQATGVQRVAEVDAEVRFLTDGCACCTVRADLYGPIATFTRGGERPSEILIVDTTGTPTVAARTLLEPEADGSGGRLHRTLFALSGPAATASLVEGATTSPLSNQGLLLADGVLLSGAASCTLQGRRRLRQEIAARTPLARVALVGRPRPSYRRVGRPVEPPRRRPATSGPPAGMASTAACSWPSTATSITRWSMPG